MNWWMNERTNKWTNKSKMNQYKVHMNDISKGDAIDNHFQQHEKHMIWIFFCWFIIVHHRHEVFLFSFVCEIYSRQLFQHYILPSLVGPLAKVPGITGSSATSLSFRRSSLRSSRTRSRCRVKFSAWLIITSTPEDIRASYISQVKTK
jgi:hypothetical protein